MPRARCRYYVNTNFIVDLMMGKRAAVSFARRHRGALCTSSLALVELREVGAAGAAKRALREHGVRVVKLSASTLKRLAKRVLREHPTITSYNTFLDYMHVYIARLLRADYFVTSDRAACNRAIRAGLCCIDPRGGGERCPESS